MFQVMTMGQWISKTDRKKMCSFLQRSNQKDLIFIKGLLEAGKVKPVIDRCYKLKEISKAFKYFSEVHAKWKVVITVQE
jgi:NADPH:quinone reductase-like Zn-dependent oxidoreductase